MRIFKEFRFEAAHQINGLPKDHKCGRLHGHSYRVSLHVEGEPNAVGMIIDFAEISRAFAPIYDRLDHRYLNAIPDIGNPTSENLAKWIWNQVAPTLPGLAEVTVHETCTTGCSYKGVP